MNGEPIRLIKFEIAERTKPPSEIESHQLVDGTKCIVQPCIDQIECCDRAVEDIVPVAHADCRRRTA